MDDRSMLLVEDEDSLREILEEFFKSRGYEVVAVGSGEEALEVISNRKFQIGLLDLKLPGMDGIELARRVREDDPDMLVLIMTGYPSVESVKEAAESGVYDYIVKPFRLDELEKIIEQVMKEWRMSRENRRLRKKLADLEGGIWIW
ncbi:MAG TPA: response regulator [Candidatus Latescibacteria bacterium]|nr:response regulator [Candidatus Latescibacterota bacterium]